ncbi:MAG TPA: cupin domain-containing protein, partial [bacterium]|nr:cupin domain-containing protein [bacterium]
TFGKGNLIFRDWGKMAYTLIRRDTGAGVRVRVQSQMASTGREMTREERTRWILTGPVEEIVVREPVVPVIPATASGMPSVTCARCGERTMETRTVASAEGPLCRPCATTILPAIPDVPALKPDRIIRTLDLKHLPEEDGLFNEAYRSEDTLPADALPKRYSGTRRIATSIYYMLTPGMVSRMHRVASDEIFHLLAGGPVRMLQLGHQTGEGREMVLGMNLEAGQRPMTIVPAGIWQGMALMPGAAFALFGCTVAPGFEFDDFELGHRDTLIQDWPAFADIITQMTQ